MDAATRLKLRVVGVLFPPERFDVAVTPRGITVSSVPDDSEAWAAYLALPEPYRATVAPPPVRLPEPHKP